MIRVFLFFVFILAFGFELQGQTLSRYQYESLLNPYGAGSIYRSDGYMNPYSRNGSRYSDESWTNPYASSPPRLYSRSSGYRGEWSSNRYSSDSTSNPYGRYGNRYSSESPLNRYSGESYLERPLYVFPSR